MKSLAFDTGPIISLATNNLLFILEPLKKKFNGNFFITDAVKRELIDKPIETKKFKFEALQVERLIEKNVLEVIDSGAIRNDSVKLLNLTNETFKAYNNPLKIVHFAEMSAVAAALQQKSEAIVVDEKTTRLFIENPRLVVEILRRTLHTPININESNLRAFRQMTSQIKVIRSIELVAVAFELGILNEYLTNIPDAKRKLLESVLWGVKLNGCAVSEQEINQLMKIELR